MTLQDLGHRTDDDGMTAIRVKCPTCGHVEVAADEITLILNATGDLGAYGFTCPDCSQMVDTPANRTVVALLIAAGVKPVKRDDEVEAAVPILALEDLSPEPEAAPFTSDDVIAFHFLLEDDVAIAEMFALGH
jgi:hypothetical protein